MCHRSLSAYSLGGAVTNLSENVFQNFSSLSDLWVRKTWQCCVVRLSFFVVLYECPVKNFVVKTSSNWLCYTWWVSSACLMTSHCMLDDFRCGRRPPEAWVELRTSNHVMADKYLCICRTLLSTGLTTVPQNTFQGLRSLKFLWVFQSHLRWCLLCFKKNMQLCKYSKATTDGIHFVLKCSQEPYAELHQLMMLYLSPMQALWAASLETGRQQGYPIWRIKLCCWVQ